MMAILLARSLFSREFIPGIFTSDDKTTLLLVGIATALAAAFSEELGWTGIRDPRTEAASRCGQYRAHGTASARILMPRGTAGVPLLTCDLVWVAAVRIAIAGVAVANAGSSRSNRSGGVWLERGSHGMRRWRMSYPSPGKGAAAGTAATRGATSRLRPILMTTFAMIAGMLPVAFGAEQLAPLGRAVIGDSRHPPSRRCWCCRRSLLWFSVVPRSPRRRSIPMTS
jgi:hypothetical protein